MADTNGKMVAWRVKICGKSEVLVEYETMTPGPQPTIIPCPTVIYGKDVYQVTVERINGA